MKLIGVPGFRQWALTPAKLSSFCVKFTLAFFIAGAAAGISSSYAQTNAEPTHDSHTGLVANEKDHSHAQGTSHEHNVEHMLELLGVPEQVDKSAGDVLKLYSAKVNPGETDANIKAIIDAYQRDATLIVQRVLAWESIKPNYIRSYATRMSEEDVADVNSFLQSSAGQKFISTQADASIEINQTTKHLMEADMAEPLAQLGKQLRDGLAKVRAAQLGAK